MHTKYTKFDRFELIEDAWSLKIMNGKKLSSNMKKPFKYLKKFTQ